MQYRRSASLDEKDSEEFKKLTGVEQMIVMYVLCMFQEAAHLEIIGKFL